MLRQHYKLLAAFRKVLTPKHRILLEREKTVANNNLWQKDHHIAGYTL